MISHRGAKDEMLTYIKLMWSDGLANGLPNSDPVLPPISFTSKGVGYVPSLNFRNIEKIKSIKHDEHTALVTLSNFDNSQTTLPGGKQQGCKAKYTTNGVGAIQLFFSRNNYTSDEEDLLTAIANEMILGKGTDNCIFRNTVVRDLPEQEKFFRTNVTFEYEYDTAV